VAVAVDVKNVLEITQQVFDPKYLGPPVPDGRMHKGGFEAIQASMGKRFVD
jgi:hypothetical protein